jgi:hypothetical protein
MKLLKIIKMLFCRTQHFEVVKFSDVGPCVVATPELIEGWYVDAHGIICQGGEYE